LTGGSVGLAEHEQRIRRPANRSRRFVVRHWSREETAPFPPARVLPRLAKRLVNSFLSPVVKYHGLGRATGFGDGRPCNTLASLPGAQRLLAYRGLAGPLERAGLRITLFRLATSRPASFRAAFPLGSC